MYSVTIFFDAEIAFIPRLLRLFGWLKQHNVKPLRTGYDFSPTGMRIRMIFAAEASAIAIAKEFEGEVVRGVP